MRFSTYKEYKDVEHVININSLEIFHPPHNKRINLVRDNRSFMNSDGYWQVFPIGFDESRVYIVCPHCGEIHSHGRGKKPDYHYEGHRAPHCDDYEVNDYIILRQE